MKKKKKAKAKPKAKTKPPAKPAPPDGRGPRPSDPNKFVKWLVDRTAENRDGSG